jgi:hypothetical protein
MLFHHRLKVWHFRIRFFRMSYPDRVKIGSEPQFLVVVIPVTHNVKRKSVQLVSCMECKFP